MEHLSNIELYYTEPVNISGGFARIIGDDCHHISVVMRHKAGDLIHLTNGEGKIFYGNISSINKNEVSVKIEKEIEFNNNYKNLIFCIPRLKSTDRFEFAIEKSVEMGITNFIIFSSKRVVSKTSKINRWNKIAISAMKQSLRSYLPEIIEVKSFSELLNFEGDKIIFEQNSDNKLSGLKISDNKKYLFIFGPEGGLDKVELENFNKSEIFNISENRLRTETAVVKVAAMMDLLI